MATGFLGGARDRLLPASIPFRFFLSAAGFQVLALAALVLAASEVPGFRGGTGPVLAAIHLLTLGVLAMTAIGASYQLLPVVTRRPLASDRAPRLSFWLLLPGICVMTFGMALASAGPMKIGAALVGLGLAVFALVTAENLRRAGSVPAVAAHGWLALASLIALVAAGLVLIWDFGAGFLGDHMAMAELHMILATFGFMGSLALGFSLILIPMFVLSRSLPQGRAWAQLGLAALGLAAISAGAAFGISALEWLALGAGFLAVGCHLWLMQRAFATSMRRRLGRPFLLIRVSWGFLILGLLLGAAIFAGIGIPNGPALAGFVLLVGWLLTFLTGVLQRIMPFLASMHATGKTGAPPLLSDLTAETPLTVHAVCHLAFVALGCAGIVLGSPIVVGAGATVGLVGALAFAVFAGNVVLKLRGPVAEE